MTPLSLYIHFPWCIKKCPYCDFNSYQATEKDNFSIYMQALMKEVMAKKSQVGEREVKSIFFGGGTPSLMPEKELTELLNRIKATYSLSKNTEITLEMNPETLNEKKLETFLQAGINRLSIGGQSFNEKHLKILGRIHSKEKTIQTCQYAKKAGFKNINIDMMYHLPNQTLNECMDDLKQAIDLETHHLSWYTLTYEPKTVFYKTKPKRAATEESFAMMQQGQELLKQAGFEQYEISAYSKQTPCIHNINYWTYGDYIGFGCGSHSKLTQDNSIWRWYKKALAKTYIDDPITDIDRSQIKQEDLMFEFFLNHMRLRSPLSKALFTARTKIHWPVIADKIKDMVDMGYFTEDEDNLYPTEKSFLFYNDAVSEFLPG